MKKIYLALVALTTVTNAISQMGQIQNGGFENWTNTTLYDYPSIWNSSNQDGFSGVSTVNKSMDAQLGTYSAEIWSLAQGPNPDTLFGYTYHGTLNGGPSAGVPYLAAFNTVKFQYKCNMLATDNLYVLAIRFVGGAPVSMDILPAATGVVNTWTQGSVTLPVFAPSVQEELFLAFIMGDPINGVLNSPNTWARVDNVQLYNGAVQAAANVPDPSFESWSTQVTELPDNWMTSDPFFVGQGYNNAIKTVDANTGTYALQMTNDEDLAAGNTYYPVVSLNDMFYQTPVPYNATPTTFSGSYKYATMTGDQGNVFINFYQNGVVIGSHNETFVANASYTNFSSPLTITGTPDSIYFMITAGNNTGSVLKLDDLSFSGGTVGLAEFAKIEASIYPNPASSVVMIKSEGVYSFEMVNMTGAVVRSASNLIGAQEINLSNVTPGTYFIRINNANASEVHKLIVE